MNLKFNALIPELNIKDIKKSLNFYVGILGFSVEYQRPQEGFAFLTLGNAQLMLDQINKGRTWKSGKLEHPLGRGINFQIEVDNVQALINKLSKNQISLFMSLEEKWYQINDHEEGNKQFIVQDPDGYLLRFTEDIGVR